MMYFLRLPESSSGIRKWRYIVYVSLDEVLFFKYIERKKCSILVTVGKIAGAAYGIWWITDLFLFGYRYYYDGNGVDINPW